MNLLLCASVHKRLVNQDWKIDGKTSKHLQQTFIPLFYVFPFFWIGKLNNFFSSSPSLLSLERSKEKPHPTLSDANHKHKYFPSLFLSLFFFYHRFLHTLTRSAFLNRRVAADFKLVASLTFFLVLLTKSIAIGLKFVVDSYLGWN